MPHLQPTTSHPNDRGIKLTVNEFKMAGPIQPISVEGRYFWVDGKRVGVLSLQGAVLHDLISLLTSPVGHSSW